MSVWLRILAASIGLVTLRCGPADAGTSPTDLGAPDGMDAAGADAGPGDLELSDTGRGTEEVGLLAGTGLDAFVPIDEVDRLPWVRGPQGGHHVYGGLSLSAELVQGIEAGAWDDIAHGYRLDAPDGTPVAEAWLLGGLRPDGDGRLESWGVLLVLAPGISPHALARESLTYRVFVELPDGSAVEQEAAIQTRCCL